MEQDSSAPFGRIGDRGTSPGGLHRGGETLVRDNAECGACGLLVRNGHYPFLRPYPRTGNAKTYAGHGQPTAHYRCPNNSTIRLGPHVSASAPRSDLLQWYTLWTKRWPNSVRSPRTLSLCFEGE